MENILSQIQEKLDDEYQALVNITFGRITKELGGDLGIVKIYTDTNIVSSWQI